MKKRTHAEIENRRFLIFISALLCAVLLFIVNRQGGVFRSYPRGGTLLPILALVGAFYSGAMMVLAGHFRHRPQDQNELRMLERAIRLAAVVGVLAAGLHATGLLSDSWAVMAGFAGLLMVWRRRTNLSAARPSARSRK